MLCWSESFVLFLEDRKQEIVLCGGAVSCVFLFPALWLSTFAYDGVDYGDGCDGDDVADAAFEVGEVYGFVETHLEGTDDFDFTGHVLYEFAGCVGAGEVGEDESVYVAAFEAGEGVFAVA